MCRNGFGSNDMRLYLNDSRVTTFILSEAQDLAARGIAARAARSCFFAQDKSLRQMPIAVLFPHYHHPAIEERYASWQSELLLRAGDITYYDPDEPARDAISGLNAEYVLVVAD